jgi:hypothetical protein
METAVLLCNKVLIRGNNSLSVTAFCYDRNSIKTRTRVASRRIATRYETLISLKLHVKLPNRNFSALLPFFYPCFSRVSLRD